MQTASSILTESARGIENYRKGEMLLRIRQASGSPAGRRYAFNTHLRRAQRAQTTLVLSDKAIL